MRGLDLNQRVLDKLAHVTQLTAEIRGLVAAEQPDELPSIDAASPPSTTSPIAWPSSCRKCRSER